MQVLPFMREFMTLLATAGFSGDPDSLASVVIEGMLVRLLPSPNVTLILRPLMERSCSLVCTSPSLQSSVELEIDFLLQGLLKICSH